MMVKRYDLCWPKWAEDCAYIGEDSVGDYVKYDDYVVLRNTLQNCVDKLNWLMENVGACVNTDCSYSEEKELMDTISNAQAVLLDAKDEFEEELAGEKQNNYFDQTLKGVAD